MFRSVKPYNVLCFLFLVCVWTIRDSYRPRWRLPCTSTSVYWISNAVYSIQARFRMRPPYCKSYRQPKAIITDVSEAAETRDRASLHGSFHSFHTIMSLYVFVLLTNSFRALKTHRSFWKLYRAQSWGMCEVCFLECYGTDYYGFAPDDQDSLKWPSNKSFQILSQATIDSIDVRRTLICPSRCRHRPLVRRNLRWWNRMKQDETGWNRMKHLVRPCQGFLCDQWYNLI